MWWSIQGMYEYDPTVFDGFDAPSFTDSNNVVHTLNRDNVINNILLQCAELEVVYPSIQMMKFAIGVWSASNSEAWDKLYATQLVKYNPIWNVDADITINRGGDSENTEKVSGYNSEAWSNANKNETEYGELMTERRTGNIGVTATQDLLKKEREIADFSIVEYITQSFKERFCLLVY